MTWLINVHRDAAKQLEAIPPDRRTRILNFIRDLANDPSGGLVKPLKGKSHRGLFRKVSGRYRIIFEPLHSTHTVHVLGVLLRNEATYR
jgi:mRNA-degrading endonuclease RelE of RelBE toxin-antitoxin system